jgi:hypothetical protein
MVARKLSSKRTFSWKYKARERWAGKNHGLAVIAPAVKAEKKKLRLQITTKK